MVYYSSSYPDRGGHQAVMAVRQVVVLLLTIVLLGPTSWADDPPSEISSSTPSPDPGHAVQETAPPPTRSVGSTASRLDVLREAIRLHPKEATAYYELAIGLLTPLVDNHEPANFPPTPPSPLLDAIQALRTASQLAPEWVEPRLLLGETLFRAGDLDGALGEYRGLLQRGRSEPRAHLGLAKGLMAKQDWPAAQAELKETLREDPTLVEAHYLLGAVLYSQGRLRAAIETYRKTLWLRPELADAHHQLGLLLKLGNRDREAVEEFQKAAKGEVPEAQYFLGQAYRNGKGVAPDLVQTIHWWVRAVELGHAPAWSALKQLRRVARSSESKNPPKAATDLLKAFTDYRASLWQEVPELARNAEEDSVGLALLSRGRGAEAIQMLIREAWGLSESAHDGLKDIYEHGVPGEVPAFDPRILTFLEQCAIEDVPASKITLARIYFLGLGVPKDQGKAKSLLKGLPKAERLRLWEQFSSEASPQ